MTNLHIAFFCLPHPPHVHPVLSIVSTLVRRGHRVTFVTSDLFESKVARLGAEVIRCRRFLKFSPDGTHGWDREHLFDLAARTLDEVSQFYETNRPQLIIHDRAFLIGRILANRWKLPAITTTPVLAFEKATADQLSEPAVKLRETLMGLSRSADGFFARYGICEAGSYFRDEKLNIYLYPRLYQLEGVAFEEGHFYAGRCAAERPYSSDWRLTPAGNKPVILVSMSTAQFQQPGYFKLCIDALSPLQYRVVLAIGDYIDPRTLGILPPNFEILQHIPLVQILPHVDLFLFQGGPASAVEAMYHGVPLVMMSPGQPDLDSYAENAARLGIGIHLKKVDTTAERIRASVLRIREDAALVRRVKQVQKAVRREPGPEETANRIEDYFEQDKC